MGEVQSPRVPSMVSISSRCRRSVCSSSASQPFSGEGRLTAVARLGQVRCVGRCGGEDASERPFRVALPRREQSILVLAMHPTIEYLLYRLVRSVRIAVGPPRRGKGTQKLGDARAHPRVGIRQSRCECAYNYVPVYTPEKLRVATWRR